MTYKTKEVRKRVENALSECSIEKKRLELFLQTLDLIDELDDDDTLNSLGVIEKHLDKQGFKK